MRQQSLLANLAAVKALGGEDAPKFSKELNGTLGLVSSRLAGIGERERERQHPRERDECRSVAGLFTRRAGYGIIRREKSTSTRVLGHPSRPQNHPAKLTADKELISRPLSTSRGADSAISSSAIRRFKTNTAGRILAAEKLTCACSAYVRDDSRRTGGPAIFCARNDHFLYLKYFRFRTRRTHRERAYFATQKYVSPPREKKKKKNKKSTAYITQNNF